MSLLSLDTDVLLLLMTYLNPRDRINLVLSGALGGIHFTEEQLQEPNDFWVQRIEFGTHPGSLPIQVKSLQIIYNRRSYRAHILDDLFKEEIMRLIRNLNISCLSPSTQFEYRVEEPIEFQFHARYICSLEHLEELTVSGPSVKFTDLDMLASSCHKITRLSVSTLTFEDFEITRTRSVKKRVRRFFGKLKYLGIGFLLLERNLEREFFLEMIRWCGNLLGLDLSYVKLSKNHFEEWDTNATNLNRKLQTLKLEYVCTHLVRRLLPLYPNIQNLYVNGAGHNPPDCRKWFSIPNDPNYGKQLQILRIESSECIFEILALYPNVSKLFVHLTEYYGRDDIGQLCKAIGTVQEVKILWWELFPEIQVLEELGKNQQLRRMTLSSVHNPYQDLPSDSLYNAFSKLKHLGYLELEGKFNVDSIHAAHRYLEERKGELITHLRQTFTAVCIDSKDVVASVCRHGKFETKSKTDCEDLSYASYRHNAIYELTGSRFDSTWD